MKTVLKNTKRILAVMLAFALVVLAVPDTALLAAEGDRYTVDENGAYVQSADGEYVEDAEGNILDAEGNVVQAAETAEPETEETAEPETEEIVESHQSLGASHTKNITFSEVTTADNGMENAAWVTYTMGTVEEDGKTYLNESAPMIAGEITPIEGYDLPATLTYTTKNGDTPVKEDVAVPLSEDGEFVIQNNSTALGDLTDNATITLTVEPTAEEFAVTTEEYLLDESLGTYATLIKTGDVAPDPSDKTAGLDILTVKPAYLQDFVFYAVNTDAGDDAGYTVNSVSYSVKGGSSGTAEALGGGKYKVAGAKIKGDVKLTVNGELTTYSLSVAKATDVTSKKGITINKSSVDMPYGLDYVIDNGDEFTLKPGHVLDTTNTKVFKANGEEVTVAVDATSVTIDDGDLEDGLRVVLVAQYGHYGFDDSGVGSDVTFAPVSGITEETGDLYVDYMTDAVFTLVVDTGSYVLTDVYYTLDGGTDRYIPQQVDYNKEGTVETYKFKIAGSDVIGDVVLYALEAPNSDLNSELTVNDGVGMIKSITYQTPSMTKPQAIASAESMTAKPNETVTLTVTRYQTIDGAITVSDGTTTYEDTDKNAYTYTYKMRATAAWAAGVTVDTLGVVGYTLDLPSAAALKGSQVEVSVDGGTKTTLKSGKAFGVPNGSTAVVELELVNDNFDLASSDVELTADSYAASPGIVLNNVTGTRKWTITYDADATTVTDAELTIDPTIVTKGVSLSVDGGLTVTPSVDNAKSTVDAAYAAAAGSSKKWVTGSNGAFLVYSNSLSASQGFSFTVKATTGYYPVIKQEGTEVPASYVTYSKGVYTCTIPNSALTTSNAITVEAAELKSNLTVLDLNGFTTVNVYVDNAKVDPVGNTYSIREGATATVSVATNDPSEVIKSATLNGKKVSTKADGFTTTVKMGAEDQYLDIVTEGVLVLEPMSLGAIPLEGTKNTYKNLPYGRELTLSATYAGAPATIESVSLAATDKKALNGSTLVKDPGNESATLNIAKKDGGRTLTAVLTFEEVDGNYAYTATAVKGLEKVSVASTKYDKATDTYTLTQQAGTNKFYAVTSKTAGATLGNVEIDTSDLDAAEADAAFVYDPLTKKWGVEINTYADELTAGKDKIILFDDVDGDGSLDSGEALEDGGIFTLALSDSPVVAAKKPLTMKQSLSEDVAITVDLALPSEVSTLVTSGLKGGDALLGNLFYVVEATPEDTSTYSPVTTVIPVNGIKQSEKIVVLDDGSPVATGSGEAQKFAVEAWLVQDVTGTKVSPTDDNDIITAVTTSKEWYVTAAGTHFKDNTGKNFFTKDPAYASKVTLTKKEGTIYAGDTRANAVKYKNLDRWGNVILANVKADAAATVTAFYVGVSDSLTDAAGSEVATTSWFDINDNDELVLNATGQAALAALKLQGNQTAEIFVAAATSDPTDQPAYSSIKVNFVPRTLDVGVVNDGDILYKQSGKALTVTPALTDETYAYSTKANNKFTWTLGSDDSIDEDDSKALVGLIYATKGAFTPATGKVMIPAGYIFPTGVSHVSFKLTATSEYNNTVTDTAVITITDTAVSVGNLVFGTVAAGDLTILATGGKQDTLTAAQAVGGKFVLLKGGKTCNVGDVFPGYATNPDIVQVADTAVTFTNNSPKIAALTPAANAFTLVDLKSDGTVTVTAKTTDTGKTVKGSVKISKAPMTAKEGFFFIGNTGAFDDEIASNADGVTVANYEARSKMTTAEITATSTPALKGNLMNLFVGYVKKSDLSLNSISDNYYGVKLAVSGAGATIVDKNEATGEYTLMVSAKSFKVKVDKTTYTVTDTAFAGIEEKDSKSVVKGTVYQTAAGKSDQNLVIEKSAGSEDADIDEAILTVVTNVKSGTFDPDEKSLAILTALNGVAPADGIAVDTDLSGTVAKNLDTGKINATIPLAADTLAPGTYTFYITYFDGTTAVTKPQLVSLKVAATPAFTPVSAYTTTWTATGGVKEMAFTATNIARFPDDCSYEIDRFENLNTKGTFSQFAQIFRSTDGQTISLTGGGAAILETATASDLTGNVYYRVNGILQPKPVKVTITLTESPTLANAYGLAWLGDQEAVGFTVKKKTEKISMQQVIASLRDVTTYGYYFPSNIKIAQAGNGTYDTNEGEVKVVPANKKTIDEYPDGQYPGFLYVAPTDDDPGYVCGVLALTTTTAITDGTDSYPKNTGEYIVFNIPVVLE